jgi:peptidoglycan/xylan/chitin deacetylase (PgdA/CDA1 family)
MTMSSTPISKRRSKRQTKILEAILGLCLVMTSGCGSGSAAPEQSASAADASAVSVDGSADYNSFRNTKVQVVQDAPLYVKEDGSYVQRGMFRADALLDISDEEDGQFLKVSGSDFYADGATVKASDRWFKNQTHLVPYPSVLSTADSYTIQDDKGREVAAVAGRAAEYAVYVQPSADDPRYGILYQNGVYFIPEEQTAGVKDAAVEGSDAPLADAMPVMMYHFFYDASKGETRKDGNDTEVQEFEDQLNHLSKGGYTTLTMREIDEFMDGRARIPAKSVAITMDDNDPSVHAYAYPLLKRYQANAVIFVICGWSPAEMPYDMWEMREDGIELQSHGFLMHQGGCSGEGHGGRLLCVDHDTGVQDTKESMDYVDGGFAYAYPFGDVNDSAKQIVKDAGIKLAFTTREGWIRPDEDHYELPRVRVSGGESIETYMNSITE